MHFIAVCAFFGGAFETFFMHFTACFAFLLGALRPFMHFTAVCAFLLGAFETFFMYFTAGTAFAAFMLVASEAVSMDGAAIAGCLRAPTPFVYGRYSRNQNGYGTKHWIRTNLLYIAMFVVY